MPGDIIGPDANSRQVKNWHCMGRKQNGRYCKAFKFHTVEYCNECEKFRGSGDVAYAAGRVELGYFTSKYTWVSSVVLPEHRA